MRRTRSRSGCEARYLLAVTYVRYQRPTPNVHGHHTGIFGLADGLAQAGVLSSVECGRSGGSTTTGTRRT